MIARWLNKLPFIKSLGQENRQKIIVYLYCLIISVVFWFLVVFTKDYTSLVSFPVKYINLPRDKVAGNELPQKMTIEIKASGFNLLGLEISSIEDTLNIDLKNIYKTNIAEEYSFETQRIIDQVSGQIKYNVRVLKIIPEVIYISFKPKYYKKVPVKLNALFSYKPQFHLNGKVKLEPAQVIVSGEENILRDIQFVETENLTSKDLDAYTEKYIKIKASKNNQNIQLNTHNVKVKIPVEKFTEATLDIPVNVMNLPPRTNIKTFPDKVKVTFLVALSNYSKVTADMFTIKADYEKTKAENSDKLKLLLTDQPEMVKNIRLETEKAEFILKKK